MTVPVEAPILTAVAAPNKLPVVATVLKTLAVVTPVFVRIVAVPVVALPLTSKMLFPAVVPKFKTAAGAPRLVVVAAPPTFNVVAFALARLNVAVLTVKSPPSILTSPSTSKLLLILVVPVAAPISMLVAAPPKLIVVATVFNKLNVV